MSGSSPGFCEAGPPPPSVVLPSIELRAPAWRLRCADESEPVIEPLQAPNSKTKQANALRDAGQSIIVVLVVSARLQRHRYREHAQSVHRAGRRQVRARLDCYRGVLVLTRRVQPTLKTKPGSGPSDAALVVAARAGEKWAQEALFRRHTHMVNGLAYRLLGRDDAVDDLVQDSFLAAFRGLDRLAEPQAFGGWLASIVVRTAHKLLRHRRMLTRLGLRKAGAIDLDQVISASSSPSASAELRQLYGCLETLEARSRIALILHRVEGMSIPEIATHMGLSASTVKRRLRLAEQRVAEHVAAREHAQ